MSRIKELDVSVLLDLYGSLLTEKQRNILSMYYNEDYSLTEIAENESISRQAVQDLLRRSHAKLTEWENALRLMERFRRTEQALERMEQLIPTLSAEAQAEITAAAAEIRTAWED